MRAVLDEVSLIGAMVGITLGMVMGTWWNVNPDLAFRGLLFAIMTTTGLIFLLLSKPFISILMTNWKQAFITAGLILAGVLATIAAQIAVLNLGAGLPLSIAPDELQLIYNVESAISESYFYFGFAAFFATRLHPFLGVPIPPGLAYFMHQFVYGAMPVYIWAVVASFAVQSIMFLVTGRVSIPFGIHLVVNLL